MSDCPHLRYESNSYFGNSSDKYICKLACKQMDVDSSVVKYTCKAYGEEYKNCPIYKDNL